ncbi:reverse transcriptase-like protein [Bacillaceae bacterium Marseille-Q3522]|nr:reverse transcriptase-like protein [Bacillaceae bacterium Marseille-Q3522]
MKYKMEWKYIIKQREGIFFTSDWLTGEEALAAGQEIEKLSKCKELLFYDEKGVSWKLKELAALLQAIEEEPHDLEVYFDGGHQKETGEAGVGAVIYYKQGGKKFRIRANQYIEEMETNNEAEYAAVYFLLQKIEELGIRDFSCHFKGDSQVVIKQITGEWPCYEPVLNRWLDRIEGKIKQLRINAAFSAVSRKENKEADQLAGQALAGKIVYSNKQFLS